jgi:cobalt-zinc-cadmium efflux system protein
MHGAGREGESRRLWAALGITAGILVAQVIGGFISGSLALLADAGHMLSDIGALAVALFALWMAARPAPPGKTFGYHRMEILSALFNSVLLIVLALFVFYAAWDRLRTAPEVHTRPMLIVAGVGFLANLVAVYILAGRASGSLNIRGALAHLLGDAASSLGVILGGVLMAVTGWYRVDALISMGIGVIILAGAWRLLREVVDVLLEATPRGIDPRQVAGAILEVPGVDQVHDLHIWSITSGMPALSGHVVAAPSGGRPQDDLLRRVKQMLRERYQIEHTTLQVESPDYGDPRQVH